MKTIPSRTRRSARRLLTVQSAVGLALLALAVPYSGCFTPMMWKAEGTFINDNYEGRARFTGDLADRLINDAGEIAYPGTMTSMRDGRYNETHPEEERGWLIIPASQANEWNVLLAKVPSMVATQYSKKIPDNSCPTAWTSPKTPH